MVIKRLLLAILFLMSASAFGQVVDLTRQVRGVLPQANGGTGTTSIPSLTGTPAARCQSVWTGTTTHALVCTTTGSLLIDNGTTFAASSAYGDLILGAAGVQGSITMGNTTSGTLKLMPKASGALGTSVITFPNGSTDFSATGGTSTFLKQASAGAAITVVRPACADLSDSTALCTTTPGTGAATFLATPSSANLLAALTDETGTGVAVFGTAPTISNPVITGSAVTFTLDSTRTVANAAEIVVCSAACSITPPATLTAGMQMCAMNAPGGAYVITLVNSTNIKYGATANTAYYAANRKLVSGGTATDKICLVATSTTEYIVASSTGTWTDTAP